tara:strand:+ start:961 stop:1413 length:453 start_codon:yes stop_codon:yes gene_type:complete
LINFLKNILNNQNSQQNEDNNKNLELLCGLMVEAAYTDGQIDRSELNKIKLSLINVFSEDPIEVNLVLEESVKNKNNSKSLHHYTSFINKNFDEDKKLLLIEALWEIVLSDGKIHDFESNLIRRLSGLLYISDVDSGNARKRALDKKSKK